MEGEKEYRDFSLWEASTPIEKFSIPYFWPIDAQEENNFGSYESLLRRLTDALAQMLQNDFSGLLQLLYQVDIPQTLSEAVLDLKDARLIAERLAELMIRRELKKIETREKYNKGTL
jgi:hypothetical protein